MNNQKFKNSGVDWIGIIPNDWSVKRIKDVCVNLGGGNYGEDEGNPGYLIPCISISDFKNGDLSNTSTIKMNRVYKKKNILKNGSILIEKSGGGEKIPVGRSIYLNSDLEAYYTNFVQGLKVIENFPKFVNYCFQVIHKNKLHMDSVKQTTGLQNFEFNKFANYFQIPTPNLKIQAAISDYLDTETSKIDRKISILEQKLEKLEEYKQSVIFETVTKGLDSNVEMKDSGIDWIGEIPNHWKVLRLKSIYHYRNGYAFSDNDYSKEPNGNYLIKITNVTESGIQEDETFCVEVNDTTKKFKIKEDSILYALSGATAGKCCFLDKTEKNFYLNQRVAQMQLKHGVNKYFYYLICNKVFANRLLTLYPQTAQPNIGKNDLDNSYVPFVSNLIEQKEIVEHLDQFTSNIDKKKEIIKKQIKLLKEYKQTIIYEAVTGKMEIL